MQSKHGVTSMDAIKTKRMKSIDEFSTEYAQDKYLPVQSSQAVMTGANYVLEEIEEFQKLFSTCMNAHTNGYLKSVIEQLKK